MKVSFRLIHTCFAAFVILSDPSSAYSLLRKEPRWTAPSRHTTDGSSSTRAASRAEPTCPLEKPEHYRFRRDASARLGERASGVGNEDIAETKEAFSRIRDDLNNATIQALDYMMRLLMSVESLDMKLGMLETGTGSSVPINAAINATGKGPNASTTTVDYNTSRSTFSQWPITSPYSNITNSLPSTITTPPSSPITRSTLLTNKVSTGDTFSSTTSPSTTINVIPIKVNGSTLMSSVAQLVPTSSPGSSSDGDDIEPTTTTFLTSITTVTATVGRSSMTMSTLESTGRSSVTSISIFTSSSYSVLLPSSSSGAPINSAPLSSSHTMPTLRPPNITNATSTSILPSSSSSSHSMSTLTSTGKPNVTSFPILSSSIDTMSTLQSNDESSTRSSPGGGRLDSQGRPINASISSLTQLTSTPMSSFVTESPLNSSGLATDSLSQPANTPSSSAPEDGTRSRPASTQTSFSTDEETYTTTFTTTVRPTSTVYATTTLTLPDSGGRQNIPHPSAAPYKNQTTTQTNAETAQNSTTSNGFTAMPIPTNSSSTLVTTSSAKKPFNHAPIQKGTATVTATQSMTISTLSTFFTTPAESSASDPAAATTTTTTTTSAAAMPSSPGASPASGYGFGRRGLPLFFRKSLTYSTTAGPSTSGASTVF
ncbi:hypothetical protein F4779DRAFT_36716 [Xylariaceae sp. FL0662B]|nr:hypothetical protein F4779DRAFT_36716 [Xylariaceae sp. FL0662B]